METVYEILREHELTDDEHIEARIMDEWSMVQVVDLMLDLRSAIRSSALGVFDVDNSGIDDYSFVASSRLSGQRYFCDGWSCRTKRVAQLAKYAAFYAHSVYIRNYFEEYGEPVSAHEVFKLRYGIAGDLKVLCMLKPIVVAGLVRFVPPLEPRVHLCKECAAKFFPEFWRVDKTLEGHALALSEKYSSLTSAKLRVDMNVEGIPTYVFEVHGPEDLWGDHGHFVYRHELPLALRQELHAVHRSVRGIRLSAGQIRRSEIVHDALWRAVQDIWAQHIISALTPINAKYLTDRDIELLFLRDSMQDARLAQYNDVIKHQLLYELPILDGLSLDDLLDIRRDEFDSFLVFRDSINKMITEYVAQRKPLTTADAKEIYSDLVRPRLNQLNAKVKSVATARARRAISDVLISTGILMFGLIPNMSPELRAAVLAAGMAHGAKSVRSIVDATRPDDEIRNDNFYFLWKVSTKTRLS